MKVGLVHFTDVHFTGKTNLENKIGSCINILKDALYDVEAVYFILSGDVAFSGAKAEYEAAKRFFNRIKQMIELQYQHLNVRMIIVPGNHDCNFEHHNQIRINAVNGVNYEYLGDDQSVIEICLKVQEDFWAYYSQYNKIPEDRLFYQIVESVGDYEICFNCINTSWMSEKHETPGKLFFPVKRYDHYKDRHYDLSIGVWHHPYNWFTPSTTENNKKEFEHFTESLASVHFLGHEHQNEYYNNLNMYTNDNVRLLSGMIFNEDNKPKESGFEMVILNLETKVGELKTFEWDRSLYKTKHVKDLSFIKNGFKKFEVKKEFLDELNEMKIPLTIGNRKQIPLSDIFIFPDLEKMESDFKVLDNFRDAKNLLTNNYGHCVLVGEDQVGKTSLLNFMFIKSLQQGKFPILIKGAEITDSNLSKILKRIFRREYVKGDDDFDAYIQLNKEKKLLLIDDYHKSSLSPQLLHAFIKEATDKFGAVYITIDAEQSLLPVTQSEIRDLSFYNIKPLGYTKRNELIERFHYLKNPNDFNSLNVTRESFDQVGRVLGEKLIPSYPIFVISILQAFEYSSLNLNETSFAYCYQTLIHLGLHKAGVKSEDIDTYINFLTEFAYHLVKNDKEQISEGELLIFFTKYSSTYLIYSYDAIITTLKRSKIIVFDDTEVSFGYDYILYYLSAKRIAELVDTEEGKSIINRLFANVHEERSGNILVFVTHHSKDISFIEESLLNSMIVLSHVSPITLEIDDPFYSEIKEIASEVSNDILELNRNPKDERKKRLSRLDEASSSGAISDEQEQDIPDQVNAMALPFKQSFRSIEIVGQIIRNRKGSLPKTKLKEMITETYITGFRTIGYMSELLTTAKQQIIDLINNDEMADSSKVEIQELVSKFVLMSSFEVCVGIFSKLRQSMGIKELKPLFNEVSENLDTPAAKLVTFGINSYYGTITENDVKSIHSYLKDNPVAHRILRARVKSYVYNNEMDIKLKQKFASILGMTFGPAKKIQV